MGTFGSGKTTCAQSIGRHLGVRFNKGELVHGDEQNNCLLLGKCSNSGKYHGMDGASIKQVERFQLIEDYWESPHRLIIVDGSMIMYWSSFFERYQHLPGDRKVWGIWLSVPNEVIRERFVHRSGREWSEKRAANVDQKRNSSATTFKKALEVPSYRMERVKHYTEEHFQHLMQKITRVTGIDLRGCKLDDG